MWHQKIFATLRGMLEIEARRHWLVCSTPHALSPNALSPSTLSPRVLSPCAPSPNELRYTLKNKHYRGIFPMGVYQQQYFYHNSSRRPDLLQNFLQESAFSLCPSLLRAWGLRAWGLRVRGLRASGLRAWGVEHTTHYYIGKKDGKIADDCLLFLAKLAKNKPFGIKKLSSLYLRRASRKSF